MENEKNEVVSLPQPINPEQIEEDSFEETFHEDDDDDSYNDLDIDEQEGTYDEEYEEEQSDIEAEEELYRENPLKALWIISKEIREKLQELEDLMYGEENDKENKSYY